MNNTAFLTGKHIPGRQLIRHKTTASVISGCRAFLLALLWMACSDKAGAQVITTIESTCVNNGGIIISGTVGAGGPYQLSIISHPPAYVPGMPQFPLSLPDTFDALFPGVYTLQVVDAANATFTYPGITVAGNYTLPGNNDYAPVATAITSCSVANGTISGVMTNGRPPYTYTIINGPVQVGLSNSTGTFTGLPAGTYQVQAADACYNIQTREVVVVGGGGGSVAVTGAAISIVNCDTFSLDGLTVNPAFSAGNRFEVINISSSGNQVLRAAGNVFPARFSLFSRADIPERRVRIRVYDACGNSSVFTPTLFTNSPQYTISKVVINKVSCDSMSLDSVYISPPLPPGSQYHVFNYHPGPSPVIYSGSVLPIRFRASSNDFSTDKIKIRVIDSCGDYLVTYNARDIKNKLDFTPDFSLHCNQLVINGVNISGFIFHPYTVMAGASFVNSLGEQDSTTTTVITSFPFTIPGIPPGANPLSLKMTIRDSCGETVNYIKDLSFIINQSDAGPSDCNGTRVSFEPDGFFQQPVTYSVSPDNGVGSNTNGVFTVLPGTYVFSAIDSCGRKYSTAPKTFQRDWQLAPVEQSSLCYAGYITNRIAVPAASYGRLSVQQYQGAVPPPGAVPVSTRSLVSFANGCVTCAASDVTGEWIEFDSTLPAQTYSYILTDSCGRSDTVQVVNDSVGYRGFFHSTRVVNKCINRGDIVASWRNDGPAWNTVTVTILTINRNPIYIFNTNSNTNITTYPNGQTLLTNYPPASYIVEYSFSDCPQVYADTVTVVAYRQPAVSKVESVSSCSVANTVIVTAENGLPPYSYQIVNSTPGNFVSSPQTSSVFTLPAAQATVTVRIIDACLNSVTRTVAVTKAYPPVIRSNPAVLAACTLPLTFTIFTDSLYQGSVFEWQKITGTGAGSAVIGTRPSLPLVYGSISDTATYRLRVRVPGSCYDLSAVFSVTPVAVTCSASVSGRVLNDANGLTDNIVNGRGTNAGGLYVSLINAADNVVGVTMVSIDGDYQLLDIPVGDYSLIVSTVAGTVNAAPPPVLLPAGWIHTGEHRGSASGNDGTINGRLSNISVTNTAIANLNFGIEQVPAARDTIESRINPGGNIRISVPVLTGSDAEDGIYDGVSGINTVVIQTLPSNAALYYNGMAVTAGQMISNYNPALLTIDPNDNIASASFTFSEVDAANQASAPATVTIIFYGLPVHITSLTATPVNGTVLINWQVEEELNILSYIIEASTDGVDFKTLGAVAASDDNMYKFTHTTPAAGINFYRLRMIENDGTFRYSKIVTAHLSLSHYVLVKPNPFSGSINVTTNLSYPCTVKIYIHDATGKKLYETAKQGNKGNNSFLLERTDHLSKGMYILSLVAGDVITACKIIKE